MLRLDKFIHSSTGKYLMSIILGLGLATLFRSVCQGNKCNIIKAPPLEEIDGQIYKYEKKCFKIETNPIQCDSNRKTLQ
jgi:hypothetical protein